MEDIGKYIENENFINFVFQPDTEIEAWWKQYETDHPEEKVNLLIARKVLMKFRTVKNELSEEEKLLLFANILRQIEKKEPSLKSRLLVVSLLKYAAVAVLFFSIGLLVFYKPNQFNPRIYTQNLSEQANGSSAQLIRANGENITLKDEKSILQYQADGKLVVNNDTLRVNPKKTAKANAMNQLIIPYGKTSEVLLPDGTKVFLNAGSRLVYPENFTGKTREVFLMGEAFFEVQHDQNHPFVVQVGDLQIKVLGTRFNVSAYPSDNVIETVLSEGKVSMMQSDARFFEKATDLAPDQLASYNRTTKTTAIKNVDTDYYTLWTKGVLKFESADLNRILKRVERFYNIRFKFSDPLLGGLRISGKLELSEDREEICHRIASVASVKIINKEGNLYEVVK